MYWQARRRGEPGPEIDPAPTQRRSIQNSPGSLVNHSGNNDANSLTGGLRAPPFQHLFNANGQIPDEGGYRKDRVIDFYPELPAGKIAQHQIGFGESDVDCYSQTILSPYV